MATRMTDTDRTTTVDSNRPKVWPWVLLAVVVALALWWAVAANQNNANNSNYNNSTQPYGMTPGTGTAGSAAGGMGTSGTGDIGGVGTPSPAPTIPAPAR